ncbi:MAG: molybdate ABC transporter permease subunit [Dehalococcoidia bacterium]|nr:molybdate ABC transporter permease subunit [Dehalococcoidia bacterium]
MSTEQIRMKAAWKKPSAGWLVAGALPTALFLAFIGVPLAALLVRGLGADGFWDALGGHRVLDALRLSFVTSAIAAGVMVLVGTPLAYALARRRFPGRTVVDAMIELPIVLPPIVGGLAMLMAFGRTSIIGGWLDGIGLHLPFTMIAVVMAEIFVAAPFYIRSAKLGFEAVDPGLEEMAQTLGATPQRSFFLVTLPLAWRALVGGLVLAWARAISEFGATLMFAGNLPGRTQTMPLAILSALESDLGAALALAVVMLAVSLGVLLAARWFASRGDRSAA